MNVNALKGTIVERGYSQRQIAHHLGMSEKTFYSKMKKGIFGTDDVKKMMNILNIDKIRAADIFLN